MVNQSRPSGPAPLSSTVRMWGCCSRAARRISRWNRSRPSVGARPGWRTLSATGRSWRRSWASQTVAIPPRPMARSSRYRPASAWRRPSGSPRRVPPELRVATDMRAVIKAPGPGGAMSGEDLRCLSAADESERLLSARAVDIEKGALRAEPLRLPERLEVGALLAHDRLGAGHPGRRHGSEGDRISGNGNRPGEPVARGAAGGLSLRGKLQRRRGTVDYGRAGKVLQPPRRSHQVGGSR